MEKMAVAYDVIEDNIRTRLNGIASEKLLHHKGHTLNKWLHKVKANLVMIVIVIIS